MRPRRTHSSNMVFRLEGGNEDNDLWVERASSDQEPIICSVWELTKDERRRVSEGENIRLVVWGTGHPPVALEVVDEPLGAPPPRD